MSDILRDAEAWLRDQFKEHASVTVTYARGEEEAEILATVGRSSFEQPDENGVLKRTDSRDYFIAVADLVLADQQQEPAVGDTITEVIGGKTFVHEVRSPVSDTHWIYSDSGKTVFRIHTTQVAVNE